MRRRELIVNVLLVFGPMAIGVGVAILLPLIQGC